MGLLNGCDLLVSIPGQGWEWWQADLPSNLSSDCHQLWGLGLGP